MARVLQVFWRAVTKADFFNVERGPGRGPATGGGQLYFSISFGEHLDHEEFGAFLGVEPPREIAISRPSRTIDAHVLDDPALVAPIPFRARYRPPKRDDRYYIARQNRRRPTGQRHPAWLPERGFPQAPADIDGHDDPAVPDLSLLKIYVLRTSDGAYHAAFSDRAGRPRGLPSAVDVLFRPNEDCPPNGLIVLGDDAVDLERWRAAVAGAGSRSRDGLASAPEIEDAAEAVARAAGARGSGQGFRESAEERRAIEIRAMSVARGHLEADGWDVDDVSTTRSYDLHCRRGADVLIVEVKGTTSDGSAVLLTPNEVALARERHPDTALLILAGITLAVDRSGTIIAEGGDLEVLSPWDPDAAGRLVAIGFRYIRDERR